MPLIQIKSSIVPPSSSEINSLLTHVSQLIASHLKKPESYVMTAFEGNIPMTFGGTFAPTCYVEVKSIGTMNPQQTQSMSQALCQVLEEALNVPKNRIYIEFADAKGAMWGWNGSTF